VVHCGNVKQARQAQRFVLMSPARATGRVGTWVTAHDMRQLLLLRHAKSAWDDPRTPDHDRPLNARGRDAALRMAATFRRLRLSPELIMVSSARRTQETLHALEPFGDSALVDTLDQLYLAPAERLFDMLQATPETARSVLLIGHNPGLHNLAMALVGAAGMAAGQADALRLAEGYPTCALAEFAVAGAWAGLSAGGGRLVRFLVPADLPPGAVPERVA
jgi:phosphohistidine phosphatase